MSEMIERAAKAICKASGEEWKKGTWQGVDLDRFNNHWRHKARAAIEALREPTETMLDACGPKPPRWDATELSRRVREEATKMRMEDWKAMIDAAIAKGDDPA